MISFFNDTAKIFRTYWMVTVCLFILFLYFKSGWWCVYDAHKHHTYWQCAVFIFKPSSIESWTEHHTTDTIVAENVPYECYVFCALFIDTRTHTLIECEHRKWNWYGFAELLLFDLLFVALSCVTRRSPWCWRSLYKQHLNVLFSFIGCRFCCYNSRFLFLFFCLK